MSPEPLAHLTPNPEVGTAIGHAAPQAPVSLAVTDRLLCLAACRLHEGLTPPRSYYWWNGGTEPAWPDIRAF